MTGVLRKWEQLDTGRTPFGDGGRDWGDASTMQRASDIANKPPEAGGDVWDSPQKEPTPLMP